MRTVLLTGATGFLGRYLALEWLERMALEASAFGRFASGVMVLVVSMLV